MTLLTIEHWSVSLLTQFQCAERSNCIIGTLFCLLGLTSCSLEFSSPKFLSLFTHPQGGHYGRLAFPC